MPVNYLLASLAARRRATWLVGLFFEHVIRYLNGLCRTRSRLFGFFFFVLLKLINLRLIDLVKHIDDFHALIVLLLVEKLTNLGFAVLMVQVLLHVLICSVDLVAKGQTCGTL